MTQPTSPHVGLKCSDPLPAVISPAAAVSAATTVYHIGDIRRMIFGLLDKADLVRMMRVGKEAMREAAGILYREISYDKAVTLEEWDDGQDIYREAVQIIDARRMSLPKTLHRAITPIVRVVMETSKHGKLPERDLATFLSHYHSEIVTLIVPPLRPSFPNLRKIVFGVEDREYGGEEWSIRFQAVSGGSLRRLGPARAAALPHIEILTSLPGRHLVASSHAKLLSVTPPSPQYTIIKRFDLRFRDTTSYSDKAFERALRHLREDPCFGDVHKIAEFASMPVTLADITSVYRRQIARGHHDRLESITGYNISPFDILDLQQFAGVAAKSLTQLDLLHNSALAKHPNISFDDLPAIVTIIRSDLPNLHTLRLALSGSDVQCRNTLGDISLEGRGNVRLLTLVASGQSTPLVNAIRCVFSMCAESGSINPVTRRYREMPRLSKETELLHYFQSQPANHRAHLAVADFSLLDIVSYDELLNLRYHDDGRPRRLGEVKAEHSLELAGECAANLSEAASILPLASSGLSNFCRQSEHLRLVSDTASPAAMQEQAETLLEAARAMSASCATVASHAQEASLLARKVERELESYVQSLRTINSV